MSAISTITSVLLRDGRQLGGIIPDVVVEEVHTDTLTITDHPVEQGAAISDHAFMNPAELSMRIGWSASSLALNGVISGIVSGSLLSGKIKSVKDIYESLLKLQRSRKPFGVSTGKRLYQNMLIKSIATTTDGTTENALVCTVVLREVILVRAQTGSLPAATQADPSKTASVVDYGTVQLFPADIADWDKLRASGGAR
jgi:hypothetical protein